jgi:hypothetical protein
VSFVHKETASRYLRSVAPLFGLAALGAILFAPSERASANHLYVTDGRSATIFTYPFGNGSVALQPDGYAYVGLSISTLDQSTAIGPDGELYVASDETVQVFSRGAHGILPAPIRSLTLDASFVGNIVLDSKSYLYVPVTTSGSGSNPTFGLEVYPPFASGNTKPVVRLSFNHDFPVGLSIGDGQRLFVSDVFAESRYGMFSAVIEYATPASAPTEIRRLCSRYRITNTAVTPGGRLIVAGYRVRGHSQNHSVIGQLDVARMRCPPPVYPSFAWSGSVSLALAPPFLFTLGPNSSVQQYRLGAAAPALVTQLVRGPPSLFWFPNNAVVGT